MYRTINDLMTTGKIFFHGDQTQVALKFFTEVLSFSPEVPEAHEYRAQCLFNLVGRRLCFQPLYFFHQEICDSSKLIVYLTIVSHMCETFQPLYCWSRENVIEIPEAQMPTIKKQKNTTADQSQSPPLRER